MTLLFLDPFIINSLPNAYIHIHMITQLYWTLLQDRVMAFTKVSAPGPSSQDGTRLIDIIVRGALPVNRTQGWFCKWPYVDASLTGLPVSVLPSSMLVSTMYYEHKWSQVLLCLTPPSSLSQSQASPSSVYPKHQLELPVPGISRIGSNSCTLSHEQPHTLSHISAVSSFTSHSYTLFPLNYCFILCIDSNGSVHLCPGITIDVELGLFLWFQQIQDKIVKILHVFCLPGRQYWMFWGKVIKGIFNTVKEINYLFYHFFVPTHISIPALLSPHSSFSHVLKP